MSKTTSITQLDIYLKSFATFLISVEIDKKEDCKKLKKKDDSERNRTT
jgi:hypothetical protein